MSTATIWDDALEDERVLTEAEILKMRDIYTGDYYPPEDEDGEPIEEDLDKDALKEAFRRVVNSYILCRNRLDSEFRDVPEVPDDDDDSADFDFYGDIITVEWKEWDRCGDRDYFTRSFPLAHLWAPSWEDAIREEVRVRDAAKKAQQEAYQAKMAADREAADRRQLAALLDKYGIPQDYRPGGVGK